MSVVAFYPDEVDITMYWNGEGSDLSDGASASIMLESLQGPRLQPHPNCDACGDCGAAQPRTVWLSRDTAQGRAHPQHVRRLVSARAADD